MAMRPLVIGQTDVSRCRALLSTDQRSTVPWLALLAYFILVGGTPGSEFNGLIRSLNACIAVVLITRWIWTLRVDHDATDELTLAALLLFLGACVLSMFPRQSLDAGVQATALVAAFYFARRRLPGSARLRVETCGAWLCIGLSLIVLVAWGATWFAWLQASGGIAPPLSLVPPTGTFGNRHDVALLVMLLVPFLWTQGFQRRRPISIVGSVLAISVLLIDGSRNLLLAAVASSLILFFGFGLHVRLPRLRVLGTMLAAIALAVTVLVANSPALSSRVANVATVFTRFSLWNESVGVWLAHPLAGVGPGGFPFSYQLSEHFRNSLFDPRHPDNALIQLLVETGLLGLAAGTICVAVLVIGARTRKRSELCAVWALLFFAFTTVGANPTDFLFLLAPAVVWASFLVPSDSGPREHRSSSLRSSTVIAGLLSSGNVMIAAAVLATSVASISYQIGWMAYQRGDGAGAASALDLAITLDPSLAIYRRERGSLAFAAGQWDQAATSYGDALSINRYDPVAWRGLALTELQLSKTAASIRAAKVATDLMFLSPQNQIVLAAAAREDLSTFETATRTALEQAPQLAVVSWDGTILGFADRVAVARRAAETSLSEVGPNVSFGRLLLAVLTGRPDMAEAAMRGVPPVQRRSAASLASFAACDLDAADMLIDDASKTEGEFPSFWIARSVVSAATGHQHQRIVAMSVRVLRLPDGPPQWVVSALAGDRSDAWRYRRVALGVRSPLAGLPSSGGGLSFLISDPASAFASLGTTWPPACQ